MKKLIAVFLVVCSTAKAQYLPVWARSIQPSVVHSMVLDKQSYLYLAGYFTTQTPSVVVDFDPGPGTASLACIGQDDIYIGKYDPAGNYLWAKKIGEDGSQRCYRIRVDASDNIYICGAFQDTCDFDPGPGTYTLGAAGWRDGFFAKYDTNGNLIFAFPVPGNGDQTVRDISLDPQGNIYITGSFSGTTDFDLGPGIFTLTSQGLNDCFMAKYDAVGTLQWAANMGVNGEMMIGYRIYASATDVFIAGTASGGNVDFDPGPGTASLQIGNSNSSIFYARYNASGTYQWARSIDAGYQGQPSDHEFDMEVDASNNVYLTGCFYGMVDFDTGPNTTILTSNGQLDAFVAKYYSNGNLAWGRAIGGSGNDMGTALALNSTNDIYLTGYFYDSVDFDPSPSTFTLNAATNTDGFFAEFDNAGNFTSAFALGNSNTDFAEEVITRNNAIYLGGHFTYTVDFDPGPATYSMSATQSEAYYVKYTQTSSGLIENSSINNVSLYPNPSCKTIFVSFAAYGAGDEGLSLVVYNSFGEIILTSEIKNGKAEIDLGSYACGIYYIKAGAEVKKIIKQN